MFVANKEKYNGKFTVTTRTPEAALLAPACNHMARLYWQKLLSLGTSAQPSMLRCEALVGDVALQVPEAARHYGAAAWTSRSGYAPLPEVATPALYSTIVICA